MIWGKSFGSNSRAARSASRHSKADFSCCWLPSGAENKHLAKLSTRGEGKSLLVAGWADSSCEINAASVIPRRKLPHKGKEWKQILHDTFIFVLYLIAPSKSLAALHYGGLCK